MRRGVLLAVAAGAVLLVIFFPFYVTAADLFFCEGVAIQALFALSVNVLVGHTGIPSFGQAAFFGVGAYVVAVLSPHMLPAPLLLLVAMGLAAAAGFAVAALASRTVGIAFSMLTLAVAQALYTFTVRSQALGGDNGIPGVLRGSVGGLNLNRPLEFWYFIAILLAASVLALRIVLRSPFGHALHAVRDDPKRALYLGLNVRAYRIAAMTLASGAAGLAGALFAYANQIVTPDVLYWTRSGDPIIMSLIGGLDTFWGPALGAVVFVTITHYLAQITPSWVLFVGLIFFGFVVVLPRGLLSLPERLREVRGRWPAPR